MAEIDPFEGWLPAQPTPQGGVAPPSGDPFAGWQPGPQPPPRPVPTPTQSNGDPSLGFAGSTLLNLGAGIASMPRTIAQGVDWAGSKLGVNVGADKALGSIKAPGGSGYPLFPTSQDYLSAANQAFGLRPTEYSGAARSAQGALQAGLLTAADPAAIPAAMAGGALAEPAGDLAQRLGFNPTLGRLSAFIPANWLLNPAVNAGVNAAAATTGGKQNATAAAYDRLGIPRTLSGDVTGSPAMQFWQTFASRMPGGEDIIKNAREEALSGFGNALDRVANKLGPSVTAEDAGQALQRAGQSWLLGFKANSNRLWNDFYNQVPKDTPVAVSNYQNALHTVLDDFGTASASARVLQPPMARQLADALGVDIGTSGTIPWQSIKAIRSSVGAKIDAGMPVADISTAGLKQIYAGLTTDMENAAGAVSPTALSAFHRANAYTSAGHDLLDKQLGGIIRAPTPEEATRYALSQASLGGSRVGATTFNLPQAEGDLAAYQMRKMAAGTPQGGAGVGANPSPTSFATSLAGRRPVLSPEARQILFGTPGTAQDVADLTAVGKSMQATESTANKSGTSAHETRGIGRIFAGLEAAKEGRDIAGWPGSIAGLGFGLFSPNILGRGAAALATSPTLGRLYSTSPPFTLSSPNLWTTRLPFALTPPVLGGPPHPFSNQ